MDVDVGDDQVDVGESRCVGRDRGRVEGRQQRLAARAQPADEPRAEAAPHEPVEVTRREVGSDARVRGVGDRRQPVEQHAGAGGVPAVRGARQSLVPDARAGPGAGLLGVGERAPVGAHHAAAAGGGERCRRAQVPVAHVERGDERGSSCDGSPVHGRAILRALRGISPSVIPSRP
jgi:hypothetical protein